MQPEAQRTLHRRAIEAINWGMAAVNLDLMRQAGASAGAEPNQIVYWSRLPDWKIQTLTPNPDVIYLEIPGGAARIASGSEAEDCVGTASCPPEARSGA